MPQAFARLCDTFRASSKHVDALLVGNLRLTNPSVSQCLAAPSREMPPLIGGCSLSTFNSIARERLKRKEEAFQKG